MNLYELQMGLKSKHFTYVLEQKQMSHFRKLWWNKDVRESCRQYQIHNKLSHFMQVF